MRLDGDQRKRAGIAKGDRAWGKAKGQKADERRFCTIPGRHKKSWVIGKSAVLYAQERDLLRATIFLQNRAGERRM